MQVRGPMTAGAATTYKVAGAFWLVLIGIDVLRNLTTPHPDHIVQATAQHPAIVVSEWSFVLVGIGVELLMAVIALGMLLDWPWARPWAKLLAWFGILASVLCCLPAAVLMAGRGSWETAAVRTVLVFVMSIVTLWAVKETA